MYHDVMFLRHRCVIAELFMDGRPLFDLSQLLEYYSGEKEATETTLKKIPDRFIRVRVLCSHLHVLFIMHTAHTYMYYNVQPVSFGKGRQYRCV